MICCHFDVGRDGRAHIKKANQMEKMQTCSIENLKTMMRNTVVCFSFLKADGSVRTAYGTLSGDIIDRYYGGPEGKRERTPSPQNVSYFDIEKTAWRCFNATRLIGFSEDYCL